jgi:hypothetical protein
VIGPDQGAAEAPDSIALDLWIPDRGVFAALRGGEPGGALIVADGEAHSAGGATVTIGEGSARVESDTIGIEATFAPGSARAATTVAGFRRVAELVDVAGTLTRDGKQAPLRGQGLLTRTWGERDDAARRRFVTAATADGAVLQLVALKPQAKTQHGDELVAAQLADPQTGNGAGDFDEVRLSTIFGANRLPRVAGAELYRPGDEFPARLSGEAISGSVLDVGGTDVAISFFRWTLVGRPGWGTYEIEPSP